MLINFDREKEKVPVWAERVPLSRPCHGPGTGKARSLVDPYSQHRNIPNTGKPLQQDYKTQAVY